MLWRSINKEEANGLWKHCAVTWRRRFWRSTKLRRACKGRGEPLEWRIVKTLTRYQSRRWGEKCWARIFSWFRESCLQRRKECKQVKQKQSMTTMTDMIRRIKAEGRLDANDSWRVSELQVADCEKRRFIQTGRTQGSDGTVGCV